MQKSRNDNVYKLFFSIMTQVFIGFASEIQQ